ncbi:hypothetical protein JNW90_13840, partial [Micromonospora sp. STR1s_5]|nr:hypothetical protein [Micromonospora sp. STR1s_5]
STGERGTPSAADRRVLTGAACVAGVLTLVAAGMESPTDREPELNQGALATGALLVVLAIGAALAAAPARPALGSPGGRPHRGGPASASGWSVPSRPANDSCRRPLSGRCCSPG